MGKPCLRFTAGCIHRHPRLGIGCVASYSGSPLTLRGKEKDMAYLKDIGEPRCYECSKPANVEGFNHYNASCGYYCRLHGERKVAMLDSYEKALAPPGKSR